MTIGDRVIMNSGPDESNVSREGHLQGTVRSETLPGPTAATVQWDNGEQIPDIPVGALLKLHGSAETTGILIGTYVQLTQYPTVAGGGAPKSPAASGVVIGCYIVTDYGEDTTDDSVVVADISVQDGNAVLSTLVAQLGLLTTPVALQSDFTKLGSISINNGRRSVRG